VVTLSSKLYLVVVVQIKFLCNIYSVAQKSKPRPTYKKIILKPANEIRFLHQIKISVKHYNVIRWY